jgi:hypothetical protein
VANICSTISSGAEGRVRVEVGGKRLMPDQGVQPVGCHVYDWDDRDDMDAPVHLVGDEAMANQRIAANCGAMPGKLGWVIWYGNVPERRQCEACLSRPIPKLREDLTDAQLDGRACARCGAEHQRMRPTEAWSRHSSQLFECVDAEACAKRTGAGQR